MSEFKPGQPVWYSRDGATDWVEARVTKRRDEYDCWVTEGEDWFTYAEVFQLRPRDPARNGDDRPKE